MAFWQWSKTAASDATADPTINYSEGMSPSSVNDSGRAVMARLAEYRDDTSGLLITGGTATAYTLTTNQVLGTTPQDGQLIAFTPHATNGIAPTLQCDGGNIYPIQTAPGVAVASASLVLGTPYTAKFNLSAAAWILRNIYGQPYAVPLGAILPYTGATAPNSNFVLPFGQAISRTTYSTYFAQVSTTFGPGNGTTTFNVPDLRGRGMFFVDNMGGSAANRITVAGGNFDGTVLGGTGGSQNHVLTKAELPATPATGTIGGNVTSSSNVAHGTTAPDLQAAGGAGYRYPDAPSALTISAAGLTFTGGNLGSGNAHTIMPPTIIMYCILRII